MYKEKRKFLSISSVIYLNSSVAPFLVFYKVFMTCKSIRVAQLASKFVLFVCVAEIVRQTTEVFDTLYLTRGLRIHCCFLKYLVEPFSKQSCSEINAFKVWFNDASKWVNNRAENRNKQRRIFDGLNWETRRNCNEILMTAKLNVFYVLNYSLITENCGGRQVSTVRDVMSESNSLCHIRKLWSTQHFSMGGPRYFPFVVCSIVGTSSFG